MSIRYTTDIQISGIERAKTAFDTLPLSSNVALQRAVADNRDNALLALAKEPGEVKYPIEWASDKQRKAYFATDGFGAGIPYQRTGGLANSWTLQFENTPNGGTYIFNNPSRAARFVGGSLALDRSAALRFKQPFHSNTGWQTYTDTVQEYVELINAEWRVNLERGFVGEITGTTTGRATTPRLARRRT